MRILLIAGSYPPETGGIAQFMHDFAQGLRARGVDLTVAATPKLPKRGYLQRIAACRSEVARQAQGEPFDRIVASSWSPYAVALPRPYDVFCHGMDLLEPSRSLRYRLLMRKTLKGASKILANSRYTAALAVRFGAAATDTVILHPGVDTEIFQPANERKPGPAVLLSVGRLVERKGFDTVIRALPGIIQEFPGTTYVCAGDGPDRLRLAELARETGVAANVRFTGEITEEEKAGLYRSADIFVMPNRVTEHDGSVEGFGIVLLEAAACGIPSIAGDSGGTADAVEHGETGFLVPPSNVEEFSGRISALLSSHELRRRMGRAGRARVVRDFQAGQIAERYLAALDSVRKNG